MLYRLSLFCKHNERDGRVTPRQGTNIYYDHEI